MVNNKYEFEMKVLTPINIGAGAENDWVKGVDYVEKDNKFYLINLRKIINAGIDISALTDYFSKKQDKAIVNILGNRLGDVSDAILDKPCSTNIDIKSFIKSKLIGIPIVPGSSLKGAIRSILFNHLRNREKSDKEVFGSPEDGDEFMRFIKITDIPFQKTELVNTKVFNLFGNGKNWSGGWKHKFSGYDSTTELFSPQGFNTIYETLIPGSRASGSIMLAETTFSNFGVDNQKYGAEKKKLLQIDNLFTLINKHTRTYLEKELVFFKKYETDKVDKIIENIERLLAMIPEDHSSCILKMSAGSGFHSITGDWQYEEYDKTDIHNEGKNAGKQRYKSRKIAIRKGQLSLMGFVMLSIITEEEKQHLIALEKEKKCLEEQEFLAEREKQEEAKRKQEIYNSLIKTAEELYKCEKYEEALELYIKAGETLNEGTQHAAVIIEIEQKLEKIQKEKEWIQLKIQSEMEAEKRRLQQIEGGLSFLEDKYDDGRYKVTDFTGAKNRIEAWMKKANVTELSSEDFDILTTAFIRIYSDLKKEKDKKVWQTHDSGVWQYIKKWVGEQKANELYNVICN